MGGKPGAVSDTPERVGRSDHADLYRVGSRYGLLHRRYGADDHASRRQDAAAYADNHRRKSPLAGFDLQADLRRIPPRLSCGSDRDSGTAQRRRSGRCERPACNRCVGEMADRKSLSRTIRLLRAVGRRPYRATRAAGRVSGVGDRGADDELSRVRRCDITLHAAGRRAESHMLLRVYKALERGRRGI